MIKVWSDAESDRLFFAQAAGDFPLGTGERSVRQDNIAQWQENLGASRPFYCKFM
jgi:hypothetical protein